MFVLMHHEDMIISLHSTSNWFGMVGPWLVIIYDRKNWGRGATLQNTIWVQEFEHFAEDNCVYS